VKGEFYKKYLPWYWKMDVGGGAKTSRLMVRKVLSLVDFRGLDMCWGWKKVILQRKSCNKPRAANNS
jgi:hypothetical protein